MFKHLGQLSYWLMVILEVLLVILGAHQVMAQDSLDDGIIPADCTPARPLGWVTYVIQANDTLSGIAARTGSRIQELARVNCISNRRLITTSTEIFVPLPIDDDNLAERCRLAGIEPERCRALLFGDEDAIAERCRLADIEAERCRALFGDDDNKVAERCRLAGLEPERCRALIFGDDNNLAERCRLAEIEPQRCRALLFGDEDNHDDGARGDSDDGSVNNQHDGVMNDVDDDNRGRGSDDSSSSNQGGGNNGRGGN